MSDLHDQSDDFDRRFLDAVERNHIHKRRWRGLVAVLLLLSLVGWYQTRRSACRATNSATHKVTVVIDTLATDVKYPRGAIPSQRAAIDATNRQRQKARDVAGALLRPEHCW